MNHRPAVGPVTVSIADVERDTGLSKDTLRVWERRYGFPTPLRDAFGQRTYASDQLDKLRVIKRLLDSGHRPGRIVSLDIDALHSIGQSASPTPQPVDSAVSTDLLGYMELIYAHDVDGLRRALGQAGVRLGVAGMVCDVIAPLNVMVGNAWVRGVLEVFEEHMYTESVNLVLRAAIASAPSAPAAASPRILMTTLPHEPHGLGLLMAETILTLEGCRCVSLGTQTPICDIVLASAAHRSEVVALSFTGSQNPNYVVTGLAQLRQKLPPNVDIWVGGSCPILHRKQLNGITVLDGLREMGAFVAAWRQRDKSTATPLS